MNFVLDASMALAWCFDDEGGDTAIAALEQLRSDEAVVPAIWPLEVTNGLRTAEGKGRLSPRAAAQALSMLAALPVAIEPLARLRAFETTFRHARTRELSSYDASYLELAARLGVPLATLDGRLAQAARDEGVAGLGELTRRTT
jgi:predicted nucleic acid-binding protein